MGVKMNDPEALFLNRTYKMTFFKIRIKCIENWPLFFKILYFYHINKKI
jgi:hypothetical protein